MIVFKVRLAEKNQGLTWSGVDFTWVEMSNAMLSNFLLMTCICLVYVMDPVKSYNSVFLFTVVGCAIYTPIGAH